jgi:hypothetical protein
MCCNNKAREEYLNLTFLAGKAQLRQHQRKVPGPCGIGGIGAMELTDDV